MLINNLTSFPRDASRSLLMFTFLCCFSRSIWLLIKKRETYFASCWNSCCLLQRVHELLHSAVHKPERKTKKTASTAQLMSDAILANELFRAHHLHDTRPILSPVCNSHVDSMFAPIFIFLIAITIGWVPSQSHTICGRARQQLAQKRFSSKQ